MKITDVVKPAQKSASDKRWTESDERQLRAKSAP